MWVVSLPSLGNGLNLIFLPFYSILINVVSAVLFIRETGQTPCSAKVTVCTHVLQPIGFVSLSPDLSRYYLHLVNTLAWISSVRFGSKGGNAWRV